MLQLAAEADIVLENFRPGIMAGFGLGWEHLSAVNPQLVMLSISGFGQTGPERDRASYAPIIHGETGLLARQQFVTGADAAQDFALSIADTYSGLHGLVGTMAALSYAQRTGIGQHVDLAMINADVLHRRLRPLPARRRQRPRRRWPGVRRHRRTDHVGRRREVVLAGAQHQGRAWSTRPRKVPTCRPRSRSVARPSRRSCSRSLTVTSLIAKLNEVNLAWGDVHDHREVFDRQGSIEGREILTTVDDRAGGERRITNTPYRFSAAEAGVRGPAPYRGEHNYDAVTDWLGVTPPPTSTPSTTVGVLLQDDHAARSHQGPLMGLLDGKVIIVTGAGRGLGRCHAELLAHEGAAVVVNDLGGEWDGSGADDRPAAEVAEEITAAGGKATANFDSVSSWDGAQRMVDQAVEYLRPARRVGLQRRLRP